MTVLLPIIREKIYGETMPQAQHTSFVISIVLTALYFHIFGLNAYIPFHLRQTLNSILARHIFKSVR